MEKGDFLFKFHPLSDSMLMTSELKEKMTECSAIVFFDTPATNRWLAHKSTNLKQKHVSSWKNAKQPGGWDIIIIITPASSEDS